MEHVVIESSESYIGNSPIQANMSLSYNLFQVHIHCT